MKRKGGIVLLGRVIQEPVGGRGINPLGWGDSRGGGYWLNLAKLRFFQPLIWHLKIGYAAKIVKFKNLNNLLNTIVVFSIPKKHF